jgi:flagellar biosynthesis chaperone FliJ
MSLQSQRELEATREKLRMLEERYEANKREQGGDENVRELSMRSLKQLINQLKEEIARFKSHSSLGTDDR